MGKTNIARALALDEPQEVDDRLILLLCDDS